MPQLIVTSLRLLVPLYILKNPFWGMVLAVLLDGFDMELMKLIGFGLDPNFFLDFGLYQRMDKLLDTYMSTIALSVSFAWAEVLAKRTNVSLYLIRLVGVILFEVTQIRILLFFFPNLFDFFFLFYAYCLRYRPQFRIQNFKRLALILIILAIPKLVQEYILHIKEAVPWAHFKHDILGWPRTPAD